MNKSIPKNYVDVDVRFYKDRNQPMPKKIIWNDKVYGIDEIKDISRAASLKTGGSGIRYTVRIGREERYLFWESTTTQRWFVERK